MTRKMRNQPTDLAVALAGLPLALVVRAGDADELPVAVKRPGAVVARVHAVAVAVVLVAQRTDARVADKVTVFLPALPAPGRSKRNAEKVTNSQAAEVGGRRVGQMLDRAPMERGGI
jgi:hypothetical protein